jgi:hypothetical protein
MTAHAKENALLPKTGDDGLVKSEQAENSPDG